MTDHHPRMLWPLRQGIGAVSLLVASVCQTLWSPPCSQGRYVPDVWAANRGPVLRADLPVTRRPLCHLRFPVEQEQRLITLPFPLILRHAAGRRSILAVGA